MPHTLFKDGYSMTMGAAMWRGTEFWCMALLEAMQPELLDNSWICIPFPMFRTYILIQIRRIIFTGDHKFFGLLKGRMGGGALMRMHWIEPYAARCTTKSDNTVTVSVLQYY